MRSLDPAAADARVQQYRVVGALTAQLDSPGMTPPRLGAETWAGPAAEAYRRLEEDFRASLVSARATADEALRAASAALAVDGG